MSVVIRGTLALLLLSSASAAAANYLVVCSTPCVASDGTTQPTGTALNRVIADPAFDPGAGFSLVVDDGRALYAPAAPAMTLINPLAFRNRFTAAERQAIITAGRSNAAVQDVYDSLLAAIQVDVSDPTTIAGIQALEAAGVIGAGRAATVLNLAVSSP